VPTKIWTYPSEFTLDASNSTDVDVENKVDSLEYSWSFSRPEDVDILSTENNNEKIVVRFNSIGTHKVTLTVTDEYGVSTNISKIIEVKSIIRPEIKAIP
jgi:PKD repeat protein